MKYYEIWFYYNEVEPNETDWENEYTFYIKVDKEIQTTKELIAYLKAEFPVKDEFTARMHYIPEKDYDHITKWFEISAEEFSDSCGITA